jgi:hypothetical protein
MRQRCGTLFYSAERGLGVLAVAWLSFDVQRMTSWLAKNAYR